MINYKKYIYRFIDSILTERWNSEETTKVLIYVNKYYTEVEWRKEIRDHSNKEINEIDIVFCKNQFCFLKHFPKANKCFVFGYNRAFEKEDNQEKLIYIPIQGFDFKSYSFPPNYRLLQPPPFSSVAISEYCLAVSIILTRKLQYAFYNQFKKEWNQELMLKECYSSITDKIIGILGVGNIGKSIARVFKSISCTVYGLDHIHDINNKNIDVWFHSSDLQSFLESVDILIIALPLNENTREMISLSELRVLGKESFLINVSRGEIIKQDDLVNALRNETIKGAALDVFSKEPLKRSNKLYKLRNVIITPHIAGNINLFVKEIQQDFILKAISDS